MHNAPVLRISLNDAIADCDSDLRVDCSGLTFIDSKGIAVLVEAQRALQAHGRSLRIVNASPTTRRVLDLVGLAKFLHMDQPTARSDIANSN